MDTSDRIKQRMAELGLRSVDICKLTGVSSGGVAQWKQGMTKPSGERLISLARALKTTPGWLLTGNEPSSGATTSDHSESHWIGSIEPWDSDSPLEDDEVELPFFKEVELAAGSGSSQVIENYGPKLRFSRSTLRKRNVDPANAACVIVSGNSMEPVIPAGTIVGIDTSQTSVTDGKLYAVDHEGLLRIKRLYRIPGGIRMNSYNQAEFKDEDFTGNKFHQIRVIGRVFWYSVLL